MDPATEIYEYAKEDRHVKNPHTMRFPFMNYYPLYRRALRIASPTLTLQPMFPSQIHPFTKVLQAEDSLFSLIPSLQHQSVAQVTTYHKQTHQLRLSYALPSNQQFTNYDDSLPLKKTFVDDTVVKLDYNTRTGNSKKALVIDFGKPVLVKHMSISGEVKQICSLPYIPPHMPGFMCISYECGRSKKIKHPPLKTRKEKKENAIPQIYRKPPKQEPKLVSPIKRFKLSYKNKQGKWCMLGTMDAPERCEDLIHLSLYSRFIKIEPLNYVESPTFEITYVFYGVENPTNEQKQGTQGKQPPNKSNIDVYTVTMGYSYNRVVDCSDAHLNLHKRIRKYRRGEKWTGRNIGEYNDIHAWLQMNQTKCKRMDTIYKQMKDEYKEWEADKREEEEEKEWEEKCREEEAEEEEEEDWENDTDVEL